MNSLCACSFISTINSQSVNQKPLPWSGLHGKAVKGVNLVTLFYGEVGGLRVPVNFRVEGKAEGKTKNDLFREMVTEVLGWGLAPAMVTVDSWYSGVENLRFLRD